MSGAEGCKCPIVKLRVLLDENATKEKLLRQSEQEVQTLRQDLGNLQRVHENSMREMRRLTDDQTAAAQDSRLARSELEQARQEVENLKRQLQDYVAEVQRVEELLQHKEGERGDLLDHFRSLSAEARSLESNNQSLNHEAEDTKHRLDQAEMRILDLEMVVDTRNNLVQGYENQIADLSAHVASLEGRLQAETDQKSRLEADVSAVRCLCVKLDNQKDNLIEATAESNLMKAQLENELARVQDELDAVHDDLAKDRGTVETLEQCLAASRQETAEGRAANQELQKEIAALHRRMDDLQHRLDKETSEVRRYQEQAAEYSQQISELRREVTNEKFEKARLTEDSRRSHEPGCSCLRTGVNRYAGASTPDPASLSRPRRAEGSSPACACSPPGHVLPLAANRRPVDYRSIKSFGVVSDVSRQETRQTGSCRKDCKGIKDAHQTAATFRSASAKSEGLAPFQKVKRCNSSSSSVSSSESDVSSFKNRNINKRAVKAEYAAATADSHRQKMYDCQKGFKQEKPSAVHNIAGDHSARSKVPQSSKCPGSCNPNLEPHDAGKDLHRQKEMANLVPEASSRGNGGVDEDTTKQRRKRKSCGCRVEKRLKPEPIERHGILDMENVAGINIVHQKVRRESDETHKEHPGTIVEHHEPRELPRTTSEHLVARPEYHGLSKGHHGRRFGGSKERKGARREHRLTGREHPGTSREHPGASREHPGASREHPGASREHPGISREHPGASREHPGASREHPGASREHPGISREHPGISREHPGASREHPGASREQPGISREHPGISREHPGASREHPGASREHPGINREHPGGSREHPGGSREQRRTSREHHGRSVSPRPSPQHDRMRNDSNPDARHKRSPFRSASRDKNSDNSNQTIESEIYRAKRANRQLEDYFDNESREKILSTAGPLSTINDTSSSHASTINDTASSHATSGKDTASSISFQSASSVNNLESSQPHENQSDVVLTHKHNTPSYIN